MAPHIGKAAFHLGMTALVLALISLPFLRPGSPEFVVDLIAIVITLIFLGGVTWEVKREARMRQMTSEKDERREDEDMEGRS